MGFRRLSAAFGLSLIVAAASACGGSSAGKDPLTPSDGEVALNKQAPEISLQTINGKGGMSLESLKGKVVVLDFWATWCGPCKESFPALEKLQKTNTDNVVVIGISVDESPVKEEEIRDFAKEHGATFAIAWDKDHTIAKQWKVESMPTTFVIDSAGTIRHVHAGYHTGEMDTVEKEILALNNESPSKSAKTDVASSPAPKAEPTPEPAAKKDDPPPSDEPADEPVKPAGKKPGKKPGKTPGKKPPKKK